MPYWSHDGLRFRYRSAGQGVPFFFQHGLGGDVNQPLGLFRPPAGVRVLALDCRGHGLTRPLGPEDKLSIGVLADDLAALMDHLKIERAIVGGISMGAAVALNLTLRHPRRVLGLVLSRPAWLDGPMQRNAAVFARIAELIREHGAARGKEIFRDSDDYRQMLCQSPDCAASLLLQFDHPRAAETAAKLERIPRDAPCRDLGELSGIDVPTLVLANQQDPIHPFEYGVTLAERIRGAKFRELTPKSVSVERYEADTQAALADFLTRHFRPAGGLK